MCFSKIVSPTMQCLFRKSSLWKILYAEVAIVNIDLAETTHLFFSSKKFDFLTASFSRKHVQNKAVRKWGHFSKQRFSLLFILTYTLNGALCVKKIQSVCLFLHEVDTIFFRIKWVLLKYCENLQTDICFEKPKFHIKIWKQNLGQNLKERNIKLSYIIV